VTPDQGAADGLPDAAGLPEAPGEADGVGATSATASRLD
jgi:hypothetical protein